MVTPLNVHERLLLFKALRFHLDTSRPLQEKKIRQLLRTEVVFEDVCVACDLHPHWTDVRDWKNWSFETWKNEASHYARVLCS
jgi:hypothetical protein